MGSQSSPATLKDNLTSLQNIRHCPASSLCGVKLREIYDKFTSVTLEKAVSGSQRCCIQKVPSSLPGSGCSPGLICAPEADSECSVRRQTPQSAWGFLALVVGDTQEWDVEQIARDGHRSPNVPAVMLKGVLSCLLSKQTILLVQICQMQTLKCQTSNKT